MRSLPLSPTGAPVRIGARLRAARNGGGFTIEQVAHATGLSKGFISRLERDDTSPSVATLVSLCEALSIPVGSLFEAPEIQLIRSSDAPTHVALSGSDALELLLTPRGQPALQMIRSVYPPGSSGDPELYTINADVEVLHVLRGSLTLTFATSEVEVGENDTMTFRGREPHSWRNSSTDAECVALWVVVPAPWGVGGVRTANGD